MNSSNEVVYITSFSRKIYETSGKDLLASHAHNKIPSQIIAYSENVIPGIRQLNTEVLQKFLTTFSDYIPKDFGGKSRKCNCQGSHKHGCHWSLWNRNAFRWYHKVATLVQCLSDIPKETKYLVWMDSDCRFIAQNTTQQVANTVGGWDAAYLQGATREAAETGFIVFNLKLHGAEVIQEWDARFWSKQFLNDHRWDDGYQFTRLIQTTNFSFRDMVAGLTGCKKVIVGRCPLINNFVQHNKGIHAKSGLGIQP